jgi:hypothetical protein
MHFRRCAAHPARVLNWTGRRAPPPQDHLCVRRSGYCFQVACVPRRKIEPNCRSFVTAHPAIFYAEFGVTRLRLLQFAAHPLRIRVRVRRRRNPEDQDHLDNRVPNGVPKNMRFPVFLRFYSL